MAATGVVAALALAGAARGATNAAAPGARPVWEARPSLDSIYSGYDPGFSAQNRRQMQGDGGAGLRDEMKVSRQANFMNLADIRVDAEVRPLIEKANEMAGKGEYRRATEYYRRVLKDYPDELYRIADEGIYIPAVTYAQHRILEYPAKELALRNDN
jgi:hypothetical protein